MFVYIFQNSAMISTASTSGPTMTKLGRQLIAMIDHSYLSKATDLGLADAPSMGCYALYIKEKYSIWKWHLTLFQYNYLTRKYKSLQTTSLRSRGRLYIFLYIIYMVCSLLLFYDTILVRLGMWMRVFVVRTLSLVWSAWDTWKVWRHNYVVRLNPLIFHYTNLLNVTIYITQH